MDGTEGAWSSSESSESDSASVQKHSLFGGFSAKKHIQQSNNISHPQKRFPLAFIHLPFLKNKNLAYHHSALTFHPSDFYYFC